MADTWKTVRVFISSTFRDMHAERDHLVRFVFPRLREELQKRRLHFIDVDLRWGVTSEQDSLEACKDIIDESRPRFICMLGGRYGWIPPGGEHSITSDEVQYGVLDRIGNHGYAFFYFRDPAVTAAMIEETVGEFREPSGSVKEGHLADLKKSIVDADLNPLTYHARWDASQRRLTDLKDFGEHVYTHLLESVDDEFGAETPPDLDEFAEQNAETEAFIENRTERYIVGNRQSVFDKLSSFVQADGSPDILAITGEPGSGKSALLAQFYRQHMTDHSTDLIIPHFIGATPGSTDLRHVLRRLCHELDAECVLPEKVNELVKMLPQALAKAAESRRVIILLDALNQLDGTDNAHMMSWLPENVPAHARIIVSSLPHPTLEAIRRRGSTVKELALTPLSSSDMQAIINGFLSRHNKQMSEEQVEALTEKSEAGNPLYLLSALQELRTLGTYNEITERIRELPGVAEELFAWVLQRLAADPEFRDSAGNLVGNELVRRFVSYIAVSRNGLMHQELVGLLDPGDPQGNVAALERLLRPYLMTRGSLLGFYHGQFELAVEEAYLSDDPCRTACHCDLAEYFRCEADPSGDSAWTGDVHALSELPYHQVCAHMWRELENTLCDLDFVGAKSQAGLIYGLCADYAHALTSCGDDKTGTGDKTASYVEELVNYVSRRHAASADSRPAGPDGVDQGSLSLPQPLASPDSATCKDCEADSERNDWSLLEKLEAWAQFVGTNTRALREPGASVFSLAANSVHGGPLDQALSVRLDQDAGPDGPWFRLINRPPYRPAPACLKVLEGHSDAVATAAMSLDGKLALSGSKDHTVRLWDLGVGECLAVFDRHSEPVTTVTITPDGHFGASADANGLSCIWDLAARTCIREIDGDVHSLGITADGRSLICGYRHHIARHDVETGALVGEFRPETGNLFVDAMAITPDAAYTVIGCAGSGLSPQDNVFFSDLTDGTFRTINTRRTPMCHVESVAVTPDGQWVAVGGECFDYSIGDKNDVGNTLLAIWSDPSRPFGGQKAIVLHGRTPGYGMTGPHEYMQSAAYGAVNYRPRTVLSVDITPDGQWVAAGYKDHSLRLWHVETKANKELVGHTGPVTAVALTADGKMLLSGSEDGTLRVWDAETQERKTLHGRGGTDVGHLKSVNDVSVFPGKATVVSASDDAQLREWSVETCQRVHDYRGAGGHSRPVRAVAITPDGRRVVSGSTDFLVWCVRPAKVLHRSDKNIHVNCTALTPDGRYAVSGAADGTLLIADVESAKFLHSLEGHNAAVLGVAVLPDGRRAISASADKTLRLWDLAQLSCISVFEGHAAKVCDVAVLPGGQHAVSVSEDGTLRVWDLCSNAAFRTMTGHLGGVSSVAALADPQHIISGGADGTIRLWDIHSGQCLASHASTCGRIRCLDQRGRLVAMGTDRGHVEMLLLENYFPTTPVPVMAAHYRRYGDYFCVQNLWAEGVYDTNHCHIGQNDATSTCRCPWCDEAFHPPSDPSTIECPSGSRKDGPDAILCPQCRASLTVLHSSRQPLYPHAEHEGPELSSLAVFDPWTLLDLVGQSPTEGALQEYAERWFGELTGSISALCSAMSQCLSAGSVTDEVKRFLDEIVNLSREGGAQALQRTAQKMVRRTKSISSREWNNKQLHRDHHNLKLAIDAVNWKDVLSASRPEAPAATVTQATDLQAFKKDVNSIDLSDAIAAFEQILDVIPNDEVSLKSLCDGYLGIEDYDKAFVHLETLAGMAEAEDSQDLLKHVISRLHRFPQSDQKAANRAKALQELLDDLSGASAIGD